MPEVALNFENQIAKTTLDEIDRWALGILENTTDEFTSFDPSSYPSEHTIATDLLVRHGWIEAYAETTMHTGVGQFFWKMRVSGKWESVFLREVDKVKERFSLGETAYPDRAQYVGRCLRPNGRLAKQAIAEGRALTVAGFLRMFATGFYDNPIVFSVVERRFPEQPSGINVAAAQAISSPTINLHVPKQDPAVVNVMVDRDSKPADPLTSESSKNQRPREMGVSVFDAALYAAQFDFDEALSIADDWRRRKKIKDLKSIGKCPDYSKRHLADLRDVLEKTSELLGYNSAEKTRFETYLKTRLREPRE